MGRTRKRSTAQDQDLLIKPVEFDIIEEIRIGDTQLRLCSSLSGKSIFIQLWSSLSSKWNTMYRYNVEIEWDKWKRYASLYSKKQKDRGIRDPDVHSRRAKSPAKRKSRSTTKSSSTKTSVRSERRKSKNT